MAAIPDETYRRPPTAGDPPPPEIALDEDGGSVTDDSISLPGSVNGGGADCMRPPSKASAGENLGMCCICREVQREGEDLWKCTECRQKIHQACRTRCLEANMPECPLCRSLEPGAKNRTAVTVGTELEGISWSMILEERREARRERRQRRRQEEERNGCVKGVCFVFAVGFLVSLVAGMNS